MHAIGTMSGTSMDGVDVALLTTDGAADVQAPNGAFLALDYGHDERDLLFRAVAKALEIDSLAVLADPLIRDAETLVTARHAQALAKLMDRIDQPVDVIGFHGQTILHRPNKDNPSRAFTLQLGDAQSLANLLGVPVVYDFRGADVAAGGEGAPLAPLYHQALLASRADLPSVILNLGGIANITLVRNAKPADLLACDVGPANVFMDDVMMERTGQPYDKDGELAARGSVSERHVARFFDHPFFALTGPKSLDRYSFPVPDISDLNTEDAMATLAAMTVGSVRRAINALPVVPESLFVAGGGVDNATVMKGLTDTLPCSVASLDSLGGSAAMMEAEAFAYLAVRHLKGLPISYPSTTGVPAPTLGGRLATPI
jgi:anhydro-N-acetylmuramic acid kinase